MTDHAIERLLESVTPILAGRFGRDLRSRLCAARGRLRPRPDHVPEDLGSLRGACAVGRRGSLAERADWALSTGLAAHLP